MTGFTPPFCANPQCEHHLHHASDPYRDYVAWGSYDTRAFGEVPRFRCSACGKTFSAQTFQVNYWLKKTYPYDDLVVRLASCSSLRAISRASKLSVKSVQNRIARGSRQVLALESRLSSLRTPSEDLAADGFESFCVSQYFPNNIHLLVGSESQFVYEADHVTLRRKGRMTTEQRRRRELLDRRFRPPLHGIEDSFARIARACLALISDGCRPSLRLWTDRKREYPRGISQSACARALLESGRLLHRTISSRAARTRDNQLFPVNYLDRELRKDLHEHVRETTCFGRDVNNQMERLTLYLYYHNYRKPHRSRQPGLTHAQVAGYPEADYRAEAERLWVERAWYSRTELSESGQATWLRLRRTPLKDGAGRIAKHVAA